MSTRLLYTLGFVSTLILLAASLYFQYFDNFQPCPLCILQRFAFGLLGISFFFGIIFYRKSIMRSIVNFFCILFSLAGIGLAGRQVWLQHFPSAESSECGVSLQYMMQALPPHEVVQRIFQGTAECSTRGFEFLSFNMAEWALIWFVGFLFLSLYVTRRN